MKPYTREELLVFARAALIHMERVNEILDEAIAKMEVQALLERQAL